jgi:hypothetical protein
LINTSGVPESGILNLYLDDGSPLLVRQVGGAEGSTFSYSIPPDGVQVFQAGGFPAETRVGTVELLPDAGTSTPFGAGFFSFTPGNIRITETGFSAARPSTHSHLYIDLSDGHNTGIAFNTTGEYPAILRLRAFETDGKTPVGTGRSITLASRQRRDIFVDRLIEGLPSNFRGVLDISSNRPIAVLALRCLVNSRGDFLVSTYPVADPTRSEQAGPLFFPQIAAGSGYSTQFIFLGVNHAATVSLEYFSENGAPLAIGK